MTPSSAREESKNDRCLWLEYILRDTTAPNGRPPWKLQLGDVRHRRLSFHCGPVDARPTLTGEKLMEILERGMRRWGW